MHLGMPAAVGLLLCLTGMHLAAGDWGPLRRLGGAGAVGSPGGSHPLAVAGDTVHAVWFERGNILYQRSEDRGLTWNDALPLTAGGSAQYPCSLELSGSVLHLIWPDSRNGTWEVYYKRSTDAGRTWGPDVRLTPGLSLFRLGTTISGSRLHVAWGSTSLIRPTPAGTHTWGEIYYTRSTDAGVTWKPVVRLTAPDASAMRPGIAASGDYVHLAWFDRRDDVEGLNWDIYSKRSTDGGATWGPDVRMTATPSHARHPQIVTAPGGRVCCIWEDGTSFTGTDWTGDGALYAAVSDDNGETWQEARRITFINAPNGRATHPKSYAWGSHVHLTFADAPDGPDQPLAAYYMGSPDGGIIWDEPERLTQASDGGCYGQAVAGTDSYVIVTISKGDRLYYRRRDTDLRAKQALSRSGEEGSGR